MPPVSHWLSHVTWLNVSTAILGYITLHLLVKYFKASTSPLHKLPGPKAHNVLIGDYPYILTQPTGSVWKTWRKKYGKTHRFSQGLLSPPAIVTADLTAIAHIQRNADTFVKPPLQLRMVRRLVGDGVLIAEGHDHRRQRRILNTAFSPTAVRDTVPIMYTKAIELCQRLAAVIDEDITCDASMTPPKPEDIVPGARKLDMSRYLAEMAFDVIGVAGFDYNFDCR